MAVKKAPITQMYQINMYCDKCGNRMERGSYEISDGELIHTYICQCGYTEKSPNIYPGQLVEFDESRLEEY